MKILIADDREENLYLLETLLKGNGYEVVSAKNGVEALEKLEKEPVDLIISDILMPKMDGFRLCSKCKSDDKLREIPFIFYTSTYRDKKAEKFALSLGAQKFLVKPIEPEHFVKIIKDSFEELEKDVRIPSKIPVEEEVTDYLKEYNEVLVKKLEKKVLDLEKTTNTLKESEAELRKHREYLERELAERKRAEGQTKRLRGYLQLQVNRMPIGLIVWDKEFRARTWNPAATKIFGFTEEEALGKHPYDLIVPKEVQPLVEKVWRRLLEGDLTAYSVNENITKDGRTIICDWANTPLKEADGTVIGVFSMIQDITERKRTEEELKARVKELEEFHEVTVGRELKMKQMEAELERLRTKLGEK